MLEMLIARARAIGMDEARENLARPRHRDRARHHDGRH
jgi:hypothetical protein